MIRMGDHPLAPKPPASSTLTDYDRVHAARYLRLLDAETSCASWQEAAHRILDLDIKDAPAAARECHAAHLARAIWLRDGGYLGLLGRTG
jgi:hypothetical protein